MCAIGAYTARKVKNSEDFTVAGRKASPIMIAGTILGSAVGAGGTVGTAETAFKFGIVGWWQTLGLAIGCMVLGIFLAQFIYKTKVETVSQVLIKTYGPTVGPITCVFGAIAIFFSIMSQTKGFIPLLTTFIPMPLIIASAAGVLLVLAYVMFGGIFGTSLGGILKMAIILVALIVCGGVSFVGLGGFTGMTQTFEFDPFFNLFARGVSKDIAIGLGFTFGVLVTQTYIQAILSAKDAKAARNGAILSSILCAPIGLLGVGVGLYMRANFPDMVAAQAFPQFMMLKFPPVLAGISIGGLMLATLGSNAGLTLGISTMLSRDLYKRVFRKSASDKEMLTVLRVIMVIVCVLAGVFAITKAGELIQTFIFLSFGMRTCVFLVPMLFAFYYKGKLTSSAGIAAVLAGPLVNIYWNLNPPIDIDPIYAGLVAAFLALVITNEISKRLGHETTGAGVDSNTKIVGV
jgi:SSS family solute:Na+ symporter